MLSRRDDDTSGYDTPKPSTRRRKISVFSYSGRNKTAQLAESMSKIMKNGKNNLNTEAFSHRLLTLKLYRSQLKQKKPLDEA
jgi:hypothetical protein